MENLKAILEGKEKALIELSPKWKRKGYVILSNRILFNEKLDMLEKVIYWYMLSRCFQKNTCFPGFDLMAKDLKISTRTALRHTKILINQGIISKKRRGQGKTNVYFINP